MTLTFHVMLQLDKIHGSQRAFCILGRGHAEQLGVQRETNDGASQRRQKRTTSRQSINKESRQKQRGVVFWVTITGLAPFFGLHAHSSWVKT